MAALDEVLLRAEKQKRHGVTAAEVEVQTAYGHGAVSGAFSRLHREGKLARTTTKRNRHSVYVLPQYADGMEVVPYGRGQRIRTDEDRVKVENARRYLAAAVANGSATAVIPRATLEALIELADS